MVVDHRIKRVSVNPGAIASRPEISSYLVEVKVLQDNILPYLKQFPGGD